jgi:hypothetical protein
MGVIAVSRRISAKKAEIPGPRQLFAFVWV